MLPSALVADLAAFKAAAVAAQPYKTTSPLQLTALVAQGRSLLASLDIALASVGTTLDDEESGPYPAAMIATVLQAREASDDATALCDLRSYLGRAVLNLSQAQV